MRQFARRPLHACMDVSGAYSDHLQTTSHGMLRFVEQHPEVAEFARPRHVACKEALISQAEILLNKRFSISFRWFLKTYRWGYLGGMPIYTLDNLGEAPYGAEGLEEDIVVRHGLWLSEGGDPKRLLIHESPWGESFLFDYRYYRFGECPIFKKGPRYEMKYARNFYEFLRRRVRELRSNSQILFLPL